MPRVVTASRSESFGPALTARFRPAQRLRRPAEFAAVFSRRRILRGAWFDLLVGVPSPEGTGARLGLVVPKKLLRRASMRNAVKRQAREAFRLHVAVLPAADLVLRLGRKPGLAAAEFRRGVRGEIEALIARLAEA